MQLPLVAPLQCEPNVKLKLTSFTLQNKKKHTHLFTLEQLEAAKKKKTSHISKQMKDIRRKKRFDRGVN